MKHRFGLSAPLCLLFAGLAFTAAPTVFAQHDAGQTQGPSKYLFLQNVELKPNQGDAYAKLQGQETAAQRAASAPFHFIGMWAITGTSHVLYLHGFDSFADLQKDHDATEGMTKLTDTLKATDAQQAAQIATEHDSIYSFDKDLSLKTDLDLSKMRFMRIILFHVRVGHDDDFDRVVKLFVKAYGSSIPEARWAMFQKLYGEGSGTTYILVTPMESLAEVDGMLGDSKKFTDGVGAEQVQTLYKSLDAAVESYESNLFAFDPQLSYPPDTWLKSSPDFWGKK
jgi:hypothetical protein